MKQVIYSEHHRGIVEYPLPIKPINNGHEHWRKSYEEGMVIYNKWLSSPPIAQVLPEHVAYFSVARGESEYEIKSSRIKGVVFDMKLIAIPTIEAVQEFCEKNKEWITEIVNQPLSGSEDLEPGVQSTNEADVASHSCTVGNSIEHFRWSPIKPTFTEECILITATYYGKRHRDYENRQYGYTLWEIKKLDGECEDGSYGWYWGLLNSDGEEWGPLEDLEASIYMTMPLMPNIEQNVQECDTRNGASSNADSTKKLNTK